jgi:hypothetical protein
MLTLDRSCSHFLKTRNYPAFKNSIRIGLINTDKPSVFSYRQTQKIDHKAVKIRPIGVIRVP